MTRKPTTEELRTFDEQGYIIVENLMTPEVVNMFSITMDNIIKEKNIGLCSTSFEGFKSIRIYNPLNQSGSELFARWALNEFVLSLAEKTVGEDLLLSSLTPIIRYPGEVDQTLHTDDAFFGFTKPHRTLAVNALYAISDFTKENGGTWVLPGSHKWAHSPTQNDMNKCITAEVKAGGVLIYNASTWHGGGGNKSQHPRKFCSFYYSLGCLRQEENLILSISEEKMRCFPNRLKQLCGYSAYKGLVGHVNRMDPIVLLGERPLTKMLWDVSVSEASYGASSDREKKSVTGIDS